MPRRIKEERLRQAAILRYHRRTFEEIGTELGVSSRTVRRWANTGEFTQISRQVVEEWREQTQGRVAELGNVVVDTLLNLMGPNTRSEHVRFEAAAKLGDWLGLGQKPEEEQRPDDREALQQLLLKIAERQAERPVIRVLPGGFLPAPAEGEVTET